MKIQNGHISGKIVPPSGRSRETARRLPPRTPQHLHFQTPIGLKSKTALITLWRKKGSQLLPEERIIDDARGWAGRMGGAFQKPVAFSKGWMTGHGKRPLNVSALFRGCGFEICEWLLAESIPKK